MENGLPEGLEERLEARQYGDRLTVMLASRLDMILFKMKAAISREKDIPDLIEMKPTDEELEQAAKWCKGRGITDEEVRGVMKRIGRE